MVMTTDVRSGVAGNPEGPLGKPDRRTALSKVSASVVCITDPGPAELERTSACPV
jgi:hypothetical protein